MSQLGDSGTAIGNYVGAYAFFDYDGEPIYVGQSDESLRQRVGRHLTNQRTDAIAMNVLDPFEVAYIEIWPVTRDDEITLNSLEFTVFQEVLRKSRFGAVLNEKTIKGGSEVVLPKSYRGRIVPEEVFQRRKHPDLRISRRAMTMARLAQTIAERDVSEGLRAVLVTQARRLLWLAEKRLATYKDSDEILVD